MNFDWLKQTYYFISNLQNIDKNIEFLLWHTLFIMIKHRWSHTPISTNDRPVEWCYEEKSFR